MRRLITLFLLSFPITCFSQDIPKFNSYPGAPFVIFLDFDGYFIDSASTWFYTAGSRERYITGATLSPEQLRWAYTMVAEDYRPFKVNVTTDSNVFNAAPFDKRVQVVITDDAFMGGWGGYAWIGLLSTGMHNVCWVFDSNLGHSGKYVGDAASHEAGHVIGLNHQSVYDTTTCQRTYAYNSGEWDEYTSWGPIMGTSYYVSLGTWDIGEYIDWCPNSKQDDITLLTKVLQFRDDDYGNTTLLATDLNLRYDTVYYTDAVVGIIEKSDDIDAFKFDVDREAHIKLDITQASEYGKSEFYPVDMTGNLDIRVDLLTPDGQNITYNPAQLEDVNIDTVLQPGTYYISVQGDGNKFMRKYSSLGSYRLDITGERVFKNAAPIVDAGADANFEYTPTRQLKTFDFSIDGHAFDADNNLWYSAWEQISGNEVTWLDYGNDEDNYHRVAKVRVNTPGEYQFVYSAVDGEGAWGYDTVIITVSRTPYIDVDLGADKVFCGNGTISCGFPNEFPYQIIWSTGDTSSSINISHSGAYWVTVDSAGTRNSDTVIVTLRQNPIVVFYGDELICKGYSTLLGAANVTSATDTYSWQDGSTTSSKRVSAAGKYTLTVSNAHCSVSHNFIVKYKKPLPQLSYDNLNKLPKGDDYCFQNVVAPNDILTGGPKINSSIINSNIAITSPSGGYYYQVLGITGQVFYKGSLIEGQNTFSVTNLMPGLYVVKFTKGNQTFTYKFFKNK